MAEIGEFLAAHGSVISAVVTAVATILLWRVTAVLAIETRRMARASDQPHVVASLEPNRWGLMYLDLVVQNTGNSTAYEIQVEFDPELPQDEHRGGRQVPLGKISLLKPDQHLSSFVSGFSTVKGMSFTVTVSWRRAAGEARESNCYVLSMTDYDGVSYLGAPDPVVQIATEVKHIREDWKAITNGGRKVKLDVFTSADRESERETIRQRIDESRRQASESKDGTQ